MSDDEARPFDLEPEKEEPAERPAAAPRKRAGQPPEPRTRNLDAELEQRRSTPDEPEADERTVAERRGEDVPRGTEAVPLPEDWPSEAFTFPLRKPGPAFIAAGAGSVLLLDLMGGVGVVAFLAWAAKLVLLAFVLRAQLCVIGSSAAGRDAPSGWERALLFDRDDLWAYLWTLAWFVLLLAPGLLVLAFGSTWLAIALLVAGSMYAAVVALGAALQDPALKYPWNAFGWIGRRPLALLAGSLGWWVLALAESSLGGLREQGLPMLAFLSLVLRCACFYALLVSARAIGVVGRAWVAD